MGAGDALWAGMGARPPPASFPQWDLDRCRMLSERYIQEATDKPSLAQDLRTSKQIPRVCLCIAFSPKASSPGA